MSWNRQFRVGKSLWFHSLMIASCIAIMAGCSARKPIVDTRRTLPALALGQSPTDPEECRTGRTAARTCRGRATVGDVQLDIYRHFRHGKLTQVVAHFDPAQFYTLGSALEKLYGAPSAIDVDLSQTARGLAFPHANHRWDFSNATMTLYSGEGRGRAVGLLTARFTGNAR